jgi:hypothetical protein
MPGDCDARGDRGCATEALDVAGDGRRGLENGMPHASPVTVELRTGDQPIVIETRDSTIHTRVGPAESADATLTGPPKPILGLLLGMLTPADATASGVEYHGDPAVLDRIGAQLTPAGPRPEGKPAHLPWPGQDSNLRATDYESAALTN